MQCCGCGAVARDMTPGDLDGIRVDCPHCGIYQVRGTVLQSLTSDDTPGTRRSARQGQTPRSPRCDASRGRALYLMACCCFPAFFGWSRGERSQSDKVRQLAQSQCPRDRTWSAAYLLSLTPLMRWQLM